MRHQVKLALYERLIRKWWKHINDVPFNAPLIDRLLAMARRCASRQQDH